MHVTRLELHDFRSYESAEIVLRPGPVAFIGANGQGKTNLVEAIDYLAGLDSHRVSSDTPLVRAGAERAVVRAQLQRQDRSALIEIEITAGKSNRARVNGNALPRVRDVLGIARTVLFSPEDLALVKGDPSDRRKFLDHLIVMRVPRLAGTKADYDRVLRQRNTLLKTAGRRGNVEISTLDIWDENLARTGGQLVAARLALLDALAPHATDAYRDVAAGAAAERQIVALDYKASVPGLEELRDADDISKALMDEIGRRRREELERGVSLVGPHRDDVVLSIGDLPAKGYASHGESWSLALALRLAAFALLREEGDDPILILDDVFAELDSDRRSRLASRVASAEQVLVTAAVEGDVPPELIGQSFDVAAAVVTPRE